MDTHGLILVTEKTELLLLTGDYIPLNIEIRVCFDTVCTLSLVKYLGVRLDPNCRPPKEFQCNFSLGASEMISFLTTDKVSSKYI